MYERYKGHLSLYRHETVGFALFLAWVYCSLFGCGLATHDSSVIGLPTTYGLEHIWMYSGLFEAVGGLVGLAVARKVPGVDQLIEGPRCALVAALCAAAGSLLIWIAWTDRILLIDEFCIPSGVLTGLATTWFTIVWARRLSLHSEAHLEFVIPCSFTLSFLLYIAILLTKQSGFIVLLLLVAISSTSVILALRHVCSTETDSIAQRHDLPNNLNQGKSGIHSFCMLVFASWLQIAFFRIVSTPATMGDRFNHYILPFSLACALSLAMLLLCMRLSRYLNITLAYRWSMPLFILSYVPILLDYNNAQLRILAYSINFLGMFGVQFGCWIGACKYRRRALTGATELFGHYVLGEGAGIFTGSLVGLFAVELDTKDIVIVSFFLMGCVVFVIMATGFNPSWVLSRAQRTSREPDIAACRKDLDLDAAFEQSARALQQSFDLTNRETDVAALLLAGRSRPFIRDELTVSINTVGSHVKSIFAKCGVHSQQELMDLARGRRTSGAPGRASPTARPTDSRVCYRSS